MKKPKAKTVLIGLVSICGIIYITKKTIDNIISENVIEAVTNEELQEILGI